MTTYGLTPTGLVPKTLLIIKDEIESDLKTTFGASIDLSAQSVFGQFTGIMSGRFAELWELGVAIYAAGDPDNSTDISLDKVCAITGTIRRDAQKSTVTAQCCGTPGTVLLAGRQASVVSTGTKFQSLADATIVSVPAWLTLHSYAIGDRVTVGGKVYVCIDDGISGGAGPSGTGTSIVDGSATWCFVGTGTGVVDVLMQALTTGPLVALAGTLSVIETPVSGWSSVNNLEDATTGSDIEQDPVLRTRRENELQASEKAALDAIKTHVGKVGKDTNNPVTAVFVFENPTMSTDGNGLPPKSVEVLVSGGDDELVRKAVFEAVAGGIETYGNNTGTVTDSSGLVHTVKFSRPIDVPVYIVLTVTKDPAVFSVVGDTLIKQAIVNYGNTYPVGKDVESSAVLAQVFKVAGVLSLPLPFIGSAPSPASTSAIVIDSHHRATFDTSRITVNLVNGSP